MVKAELRDEIISRVEKSLILAGAKDYDEGMQQLARLLDFITRNFGQCRTKDQLAAVLNEMPQPAMLESRLFLGTLKYLPQIIRFGLKRLATIAEDTLLEVPTGRPGLELQERVKIVDFVGDQHKHVPSLDRCMKQAASWFHVSEATVQRAWDDRTSIDPADFRSALKFLGDRSSQD